jgi:hypothetical protein
MQRKIHLSLIAWFSILLIGLVISTSLTATQSPPVSDNAFARANTPTEKEGADPFIEVALSKNAYFRSDPDLLPSGQTSAHISKAKFCLFVGGVTAPGSLDVFLVNYGTWGDHTFGSLLAAITFIPSSNFRASADVFAGDGE